MQVILIRHGRTQGNALGRYVGCTDEPLSQEGAALIRKAGCDPELRLVYVTALRRTQQTARILFPNARQVIVEGLREMDFGDFEGRSAEEMAGDGAYCAWVEGGCLSPCPNGEGRGDFSRRVCAAFAEILEQAQARGDSELVCVVHGGTIMAVLERFARPYKDFYSYGVENGQGYRCQASFSGGSFTLTGLKRWEGIL